MRQRKAKDLDKRLQECSEYIVPLPEDGGRSYGEIGSKEPTFQTPEHEAALRALWKECFPRQRDLYLEIGCGKGDFITRKAAKDPASDFLAIEGQETVILRALTYRKRLLDYGWAVKPGGFIEIKTDNDPLYAFTLEELEAVGYEIVEQTTDLHHSDYAARLVMTEYEKKFHSRGKNINYVKALVP